VLLHLSLLVQHKSLVTAAAAYLPFLPLSCPMLLLPLAAIVAIIAVEIKLLFSSCQLNASHTAPSSCCSQEPGHFSTAAAAAAAAAATCFF
jgi:hypothetical protein